MTSRGLVLVFLLAGLAGNAAAPPPAESAPPCGVTVTRTLCALLDHPLPREADGWPARFPDGTMSLLQVRDLAGEAGLALVGVRGTLDELAAEALPAILHLREPDHFVVLVDAWADQVRVEGLTPQGWAVLPRAALAERFSGAALIVEPPEAGPRPRLRLDDAHCTFSVTAPGQRVSHVFRFRNTGDAPLQIRSVVSGCACTTTERVVDVVPPGGTGEIAMELEVRQAGRTHQTIEVHTNDPLRPRAFLTFEGDAPMNLRVAPSRLRMVCDVDGQPAADLRLYGPEGLVVLTFHAEPFILDAAVVSREEVDGGIAYHLRVMAAGPVRESAQATVVLTTSHFDGAEIRIPVDIRVRPVMAVSPRRVVGEGLVAGRPWSTDLRLRFVVPLPEDADLQWSCPDAAVTVEFGARSEDGVEMRVVVSPAVPGILETVLRVTSSHGHLDIPITVQVWPAI